MKRLLARWLAPEIHRQFLIAGARRTVTESKRKRHQANARHRAA